MKMNIKNNTIPILQQCIPIPTIIPATPPHAQGTSAAPPVGRSSLGGLASWTPRGAPRRKRRPSASPPAPPGRGSHGEASPTCWKPIIQPWNMA